MIVTLAVWIYAAFVLFVYGRVVLAGSAALCGSMDDPVAPVGITALVGIVVLGAVTALISLFAPVGAAAHAGLVALPVLALAVPKLRRVVWRRSGGELGRSSATVDVVLIALASVAVLIALERTAAPVTNYDSGLYHAQAIRWIEEHGIVPGLGNLHGRLAFSAAWFVPSAVFGLSFLGVGPFHALTGLAFVLFLVYAFSGLRAWRLGARTPSAVLKLALVPIAFLSFGKWLSSPTPDVPVALLIWTVALLFLEKAEERSMERPDGRAVAIFALASFAIAIKLSALPIGLLPAYLAYRLLRVRRPQPALILTAIGAFSLLPHVARTTVHSGYLIYPLPKLDVLNPDWKVPRARAYDDFAWVRSWARMPNRSPHVVLAMSPGEWMPSWFRRIPRTDRWALVSGLVLIGVYVAWLALGAAGTVRGPPTEESFLAAVVALGVLLWFIAAPDPRFGWGFVPLLPLLLLGLLAEGVLARIPFPVLAICVGGWLVIELFRLYFAQPGALTRVVETAVWPSDYDAAEIREVRLPSLIVWSPREGNQCWYARLPCTPYPSDALRMRGPTIGSGFRWHRE